MGLSRNIGRGFLDDYWQKKETELSVKEQEQRKIFVKYNPNGIFKTYHISRFLYSLYHSNKIRSIDSYKDGILIRSEGFSKDGKLSSIRKYTNEGKPLEDESFYEDGDTLGKNLYEEGYLIERTLFFKNGNPSYEAFVDGRAFVLREYFDNGSLSYERVDAADDGWRGNINLHRFDNYGYTILYTEFFRNGNLKKIEIFKDVSTFNWDKWTDYEIDVYELVGRYTYEAFEPNGLWWTCEEFYKNGNKKKISSYCKMSFINQDGKHSRHNEDHPIGTWSWFNSDGTLRRTEEYVASCKCVEKTRSDHISKMWKETLPSKVKVDNSYISKIRKTKKDLKIKKVILEIQTEDSDFIDF